MNQCCVTKFRQKDKEKRTYKGKMSSLFREEELKFIEINLTLFVGVQVMLCTNLNVEEGLTNGSLGKIVELKEDRVSVNFNDDDDDVNHNVVDVIKHNFEDSCGNIFTQLPLCLAYSSTIHKSQGETILKGSIYLDCFFPTFGLLYTAFSRFPDLDCFKYYCKSPDYLIDCFIASLEDLSYISAFVEIERLTVLDQHTELIY